MLPLNLFVFYFEETIASVEREKSRAPNKNTFNTDLNFLERIQKSFTHLNLLVCENQQWKISTFANKNHIFMQNKIE